MVPPRLDGVLSQPAAQRRGGHLPDQPAGDDFLAQLPKAPPAERHPAGGRQLAGDRLDLGHDRGGEPARPASPLPVPQPLHTLLGVAFAPLAGGVDRQSELAGDPGVGPSGRGQQHDLGPEHLAMLGRASAGQGLEPSTLPRPQRDLERAAPATSCHRAAILVSVQPSHPPQRAAGYGIQPAGSAKMAPCHPRSPNRPRSRSVSGCGNASASVGRAWPPSRCASAAGSPTSTANSKAARSCRCAGSGMPARPAVGALRSTSLAETAMRTRYCQAGCTPALLRRR
jgi:hypothetical protein